MREDEKDKKTEEGGDASPWFEMSKKEPAWYEKPSEGIFSDAAAPSAKPRAEKKRRTDADFNACFTGSDARGARECRRERDGDKVYLSQPPPALRLKEITDEKAYIEENFAYNPAVKAFSKNAKTEAVAVTCALVLSCTVAGTGVALSEKIWFFWIIGCAVAVVFFISVLTAIMIKRKAYAKGTTDFRLIAPYAVKAEYGALHSLDGRIFYEENERKIRSEDWAWDGRDEERTLRLADCGLRLYYTKDGKEREAVTEKFYTEEQIQTLIGAFARGDLVAACRKRAHGKDKAVICEPKLPVIS